MQQIPGADAFVFYSTEHWVVLGTTAASILGLTALLRTTAGGPWGLAARRGVCWGLVGLMLTTFVAGHVDQVRGGFWSFDESLPLHLCGLGLFLTGATLLRVGWRWEPWAGALYVGRTTSARETRELAAARDTRVVSAHAHAEYGEGMPPAMPPTSGALSAERADAKAVGMAPAPVRAQAEGVGMASDLESDTAPGKRGRVPIGQRLFELAYFWGLGGTSQALLTPDVVGHWPMFTCVRFFIEHGAIVVGVSVLLFGVGLRPWRGAVWRAWWVTLVLAAAILCLNALLRATIAPEANYMYLCGPPKKPSLYDYFGPWPWSLLTLVTVGTVVFTLLYAPYWIVDRWRGRGAVTR